MSLMPIIGSETSSIHKPHSALLWRGLTRLVDIQLGVMPGAQVVGN
jgi:hypothetical protein